MKSVDKSVENQKRYTLKNNFERWSYSFYAISSRNPHNARAEWSQPSFVMYEWIQNTTITAITALSQSFTCSQEKYF